jgi:copper oxidase (laccase) domain-containing protein
VAPTPGASAAQSIRYQRDPLERQETAWPGRDDLMLGWTLLDRRQPNRPVADIARMLGELHHRTSCYLKQVHRTDLILLLTTDPEPVLPRVADGMLTDRNDALLGVNVADCMPLFIRAGNVFGVLHAGWRGVVGGILPAAQDAELIIGPGIGACCFEVSPSVWGLFDVQHRITRDRQLLVDLPSAIQSQWARFGGRPEASHTMSRCSVCSQPAMHSFRRDPAAGRNYAYIYTR